MSVIGYRYTKYRFKVEIIKFDTHTEISVETEVKKLNFSILINLVLPFTMYYDGTSGGSLVICFSVTTILTPVVASSLHFSMGLL